MMHNNFYFADVYGAGNYGENVYSNSTSTSTGTGAGSQPGGLLADTGFDLILGGTIGAVIIFSALVIRFWKRTAKKPTSLRE